TLIAAPPNHECNCSECPFMKLNTLEKVFDALRDEKPEIKLNEMLRVRALKPLELMLTWSK
ncbi:MAG: quinolinate synthase NadA, partial [Bdellovibrionota bacterium]